MQTKKYYENLFKVLEFKEKFKFLKFAFFLLIVVLLETFGLGLIYPILQTLTNNEIHYKFVDFYDIIINKINFNIDIDVFILILFASVIVIKNMFFFYFEFWQITFLRDFKVSLKNRLLKLHFQSDYEKVSRKSISTYIRDFNATVERFIKSVQISMQLLTEVLIFFGLIILLLFIQSSNVLTFAFTIAFIAFLFSMTLRKYLSRVGAKGLDLQQKSLAKLIDMINSTKEILAFGKYKVFTKQFKNYEIQQLNISRVVSLIQKFPKFFFEILIALSFTFFVLYTKSIGADLNAILPQLGIIFIAVLRLLPSITKALFYVQKLNVAETASAQIADDINSYRYLEANKKKQKINLDFNNSFLIKNIFFKYTTKDAYVLDNINLEVKKGDYIGIYGTSGGGKSTLINIVCGFLNPTKGEIFVDGRKIDQLKESNWLEKIGLLTQENNLLDDTIINNITLEFDNKKIDMEFLKKTIKQVGLSQLIHNSPNGYNSEIGPNGIALSGGERQRIGIARAFYARKEILVFDESTSNLDEMNKKKFIETINDLSAISTIIMISHDKDVIKNCKKRYQIKDHKLIRSF